jgi:hypothetical protein
MKDPFCRKAKSRRGFGRAGLAAVALAAGGQQLRSRSAIDAGATRHRGISRVQDRVDRKPGNISAETASFMRTLVLHGCGKGYARAVSGLWTVYLIFILRLQRKE